MAKSLSKPQASSSFAQRELDKAEKQFEAFDQNIKEMTLERMNEAPKEETEGPQISQKEVQRAKDIYLKPNRTIYAVNPKTGEGEKFNEKYREEYNFQKEYVQFIAENKEISGEAITVWTKKFAGIPAEEWIVPSNKPVWGPRYLAEQIKSCTYHKLVMQDHFSANNISNIASADGIGTMYGKLAADVTVQRLDAHPVSSKKSLFMGASGF